MARIFKVFLIESYPKVDNCTNQWRLASKYFWLYSKLWQPHKCYQARREELKKYH